jgi:predicted TIM-barrel fold metal-dependent hydrolase
VTVVDLWVNALSASAAQAFTGREENAGVADLFGADPAAGAADDPLAALVATMDACGVDTGVLAAGLSDPGTEDLLERAATYPGRLLVALTADRPQRPLSQVRRLRALAAHPLVRLVRVTPLVHQLPLNHRCYYPLYAACSELGLPVSVNIGVPGPRVRSACQHPELLEDLLIDLPGLVVIGAHMGHPYEALLMTYLLKWPDLYLSTSAYLARYMDPALVAFMDSSRGSGRVLFASDHPFLPLPKALAAARALPLAEGAMAAFLGGTAARLLERGVQPGN